MPQLSSARHLAALLLGCVALTASAADPNKAQLLHSAPAQARPGELLQVDGSLAGTTVFDKLVLRYRGPGEEFVDVKMELQYGDLYRGTIPASRMIPPGIEYYVEGINAAGERVPLFMTAGKPARVLVINEDGSTPGKRVVEPKEEPKEEPKAAPKKKKKCKKGKKCKDEEELTLETASPYVEKKEPEPKKVEEPKRVEEAKKAEEPKKVEELVARRDEPRPDEKGKAEPPRKRSELEEELAIYGAEESSGVVTRIDEKASRVPQNVTTLTAANLQQLGARTVYDALDLVPGLTVSRDVQGFHRVAVRGIRSDAELLFLLDGHRLNNFYDGRSPANLPIDNLERIEVIRGPGTADYGLGNFLAVVNLVTRRDDGLRAGASAGLWETFDGHLGVAKSFGGLKLFLDGDVLNQRGSRKPVLKDALDINTIAQKKRTAQDPAGKTNDNRFLVNVGGGLEYASEQVGRLSATARFILENRGALIGQYDTLGNDSRLDWTTVGLDVTFDRKLGELGRWNVGVFFDQQSTRRLFQLSVRDYKVNPNNDLPFFPEGILEQVTVGTRTFGGRGGADLQLPANNKLSFGVSAELASLSGYEYLTNYLPGSNTYTGPGLSRLDAMVDPGLIYPTEAGQGAASRRFGLGIFLKDVFTPFDRLTLELGLRADLVQLPTVDSRQAISGSGLAIGVGPRAGIVFAPINSLALKAHYGRAFRAPTVQELAETIPNSDSNQGRLIGNPVLAPAYVDSVEAGFEYAQTVGDARLKLKASGFFENFTNPIHPVDTTGNLVPVTNRQQGVRVYGVEGEARVELSQRSAVFLNASFFRAEDNGTPASARLLTDTPQARLNAGFSLPLGPYLNFDVTTRFGSERRNNSRSVLELLRRYKLPGYLLVGAALRTEPIADHLEFALVGQNVFDFEYADDVPRPDRITAGVPREGLQAFATVKVDF